MIDPTPLAVTLAKLSPGIRARINADAEPADYDAQERAQAAIAAQEECTNRFPNRFKLADILQTTATAGVKAWADEYRADPDSARSLLLLGTTGTGKTHAGYAAVRHAVTEPQRNRAGTWRVPSWRALTQADLIASLRPRGARDHDAEAILATYVKVDLLFIDDLGAMKSSEHVEEVTYRLLNARYEAMKPCIVTSNIPVAELKVAIGDRIASRLAQDCVRVEFEGPDRRRARQLVTAA